MGNRLLGRILASCPQDFLPHFLRLAGVNVLANLMVPLAGLIDVALLGHLVEIEPLAGVALTTVLFNYLYWTFGFLRMGTTGTTAQALGRGDRREVLLIGLRHAGLALSIGGLILLLHQPLRHLGFALLSATPAVKAAGQMYYDALIWGAPATLLNFVLIGWFLGRQQSGQVLLMSIVGNGTKIGLDYWLIVEQGWATAGAGWAGTGSQYLVALLGLGLAWRTTSWAEVQGVTQKLWQLAALKTALLLNRDILLRTLALISVFALFTNLSSALGLVVLTTNAVLLEVVTLSAYFIDGLAFATESLAGDFRGKGDSSQLTALVWLGGGISLGLGLGFALMFILWTQPLFSLLTHHQVVLASIADYTPWLLPILGFGSIAYLLDGYFLGLTEGKILRNSSLIAALVFLPMAFIAWHTQNSQILWLSLTLFMAARAITLGLAVPKTLIP